MTKFFKTKDLHNQITFSHTNKTALMQPSFSGLFVTYNRGRKLNTTKRINKENFYLRIFAPHNFTSLCDQSQFTHIHFNDGSLCYTAECGKQSRLRVLLHTKNIEIKGTFQLRMGNVCFLKSKSSWSNKSLILGRFSSEIFPNKSHLCHLNRKISKQN